MKRYFIKKAVTAGILCIILFGGFILNLSSAGKEILSSVKGLEKNTGVNTVIDTIEDDVNEYAFAKYQCIEWYGLAQEFLGKNEENDFEVIKDENGALHLTRFESGPKDTAPYVKSLSLFKKATANKNTRFLYVMSPDKVVPGVTSFEEGLPYDFANESGDEFLVRLKEEGIRTIDLREFIFDGGINENELFFYTDHHWTTNTAFYAYQQLAKKLAKDYGFQVDNLSYYTNLSSYNQVTYDNSFIGSLGRKTGIYYGGVDDYTLIYPKFETDYTFEATTGDTSFSDTGRFEQVLLNHSMLSGDQDKYSNMSNRYESYLYGNQGIVHVTNNKLLDGEKVLIVKDSFMMPVAAFLSTICLDVYLIDPRYYDGDICDYVNSIEGLDYIIVSYSPQNLDDIFFEFSR